jgi:hypothetical protein
MLDNAVRWTGMPARVAAQMSNAPSVDHRHQAHRWSPILLIAFACIAFVLSVKWPSGLMISFIGVIAGIAPFLHANGPLGKPSLEDDEREAAMRKDSFLFCFGLLTLLNFAGLLGFMIFVLTNLSHMETWDTGNSVLVAASAFLLNLTLFWCLPTLYASWRMPPIPKE